MSKLRVGVVGLGYFGTFHARHHAANPDIELVAIAEPDPTKDALIRDTYHCERVYSHRDLIGRVDAVSVTAPTALHQAIAADLIDAGIHLLVEKPLTESAATAEAIAARAETAGVVLHVGHVERFSPAYRALRSAVTAPRLIECHRHAPWKARAIDVDVVLDLMIHDIDLALDLAGAPVVDVSASGVAVMGRALDAAMASLRFANGATAEISCSRVASIPTRVVRVHEADRSVSADLTARTAFLFTPAGGLVPLDVPPADALKSEIGAFLAAVRGEPSVGVDGRQAAAALAIVDRVRQLADPAAN